MAFLGAIVLVFLFSLFQSTLISHSLFLAEVLPNVLVDLANQDRTQNGVIAPLVINNLLTQAAQLKAEHMAENGYFAHNSPDGLTPWYWIRQAGYRFTHAGENLAVKFSDSEAVNSAWMNSASHRANILNGNFSEIGVALSQGIYKGQNTTFVVQMFGRPAQTATENLASLETVVSTETFVAVKDNDAIPAQTYSSSLEKILTSPQKTVRYSYWIIGAIIILALILMVFIEIKRQHPLHIFYGLALLVLLAVGVYFSQQIAISSIVVL